MTLLPPRELDFVMFTRGLKGLLTTVQPPCLREILIRIQAIMFTIMPLYQDPMSTVSAVL